MVEMFYRQIVFKSGFTFKNNSTLKDLCLGRAAILPGSDEERWVVGVVSSQSG